MPTARARRAELTRVSSDTLCTWRERAGETTAPAEPNPLPVAVPAHGLSSELQNAFSIHIQTAFDPQIPSIF